ncbi:MAG: hypothetical protein GSR81_02845 [Desulfurococcales archaeon]|nr:hypothetical protein [Desulfurococcales archaeon]
MGDNVYLGSRVKDTGEGGLSNIGEVRQIADAIIDDCVSGRISYRTAMSRMNLLELVVVRDKSIRGEYEKRIRAMIDNKREELREECGHA